MDKELQILYTFMLGFTKGRITRLYRPTTYRKTPTGIHLMLPIAYERTAEIILTEPGREETYPSTTARSYIP